MKGISFIRRQASRAKMWTIRFYYLLKSKTMYLRAKILSIARMIASPMLNFTLALFALPCILIMATYVRYRKAPVRKTPHLIFGAVPIIGLTYISHALREIGYKTKVVTCMWSRIFKDSDFDVVLYNGRSTATNFKLFWFFFSGHLKSYRCFINALLDYDIFNYYFDGGMLQVTGIGKYELAILKYARKKIVLLPYGGDAFVYEEIANAHWRHAMISNYPQLGDNSHKIKARLHRSSRLADVVVGCLVHYVNLPRWDILPCLCYPIDTQNLQPVYPKMSGTVRIAHATNHRGVKGTVFLEEAVKRLQGEGVDVELDVIEYVTNEEALERMARCDIYVDQLVFGYALAALEAMSHGKVVISGLNDAEQNKVFRNYSYLGECPVIAGDIDTIYDVLKSLISRRDEWDEIGKKTREYTVHRHSFASIADMYNMIYKKIWWGEDVDLINYYHPYLSPNREQTAIQEVTAVEKKEVLLDS